MEEVAAKMIENTSSLVNCNHIVENYSNRFPRFVIKKGKLTPIAITYLAAANEVKTENPKLAGKLKNMGRLDIVYTSNN